MSCCSEEKAAVILPSVFVMLRKYQVFFPVVRRAAAEEAVWRKREFIRSGELKFIADTHQSKSYETEVESHEPNLWICVQVRLMQYQLDQRHNNRTGGVQNPEGGILENSVDAHLLVLQSECFSSLWPLFMSSSVSLLCSSSSSQVFSLISILTFVFFSSHH